MLTDFLIETVELRPRHIFSTRQTMGLGDFKKVYGRLKTGLKKNHYKQAGPILSIYHDEDFNKDWMEIELGVEVTQASGENIRLLAPGLCVFMRYVGRYDDFNLCFTALMESIYQKGYSVSGPPIIVYIKGYMNSLKPDEFVSEIYVPIRK